MLKNKRRTTKKKGFIKKCHFNKGMKKVRELSYEYLGMGAPGRDQSEA